MADPTDGPKVYHQHGGDEQVVASGGKGTLESGGEIDAQAGSKVTRPVAVKTANYTVLASESGMVFLADAVDLVFTLPASLCSTRTISERRPLLSPHGSRRTMSQASRHCLPRRASQWKIESASRMNDSSSWWRRVEMPRVASFTFGPGRRHTWSG